MLTRWCKYGTSLAKNAHCDVVHNYRSISKVMLPQAENLFAEEQAGFRHGRSIIEHIFNLRIMCEKHHEHQKSIYQVFTDFKKAFGRVWHEALRLATMKKCNISRKLLLLHYCDESRILHRDLYQTYDVRVFP